MDLLVYTTTADLSYEGGRIPAIHVEDPGSDINSDVMTCSMTGTGTKVFSNAVKAFIESNSIDVFAIEACDKKRERVFAYLARKSGWKVELIKDYFGDYIPVCRRK